MYTQKTAGRSESLNCSRDILQSLIRHFLFRAAGNTRKHFTPIQNTVIRVIFIEDFQKLERFNFPLDNLINKPVSQIYSSFVIVLHEPKTI